MQLLAVELKDFRNLESVFVEPHARFNVLSGDNAQGKTNLLEAVYLLGTLRSFRASRTEELVRFGCERATVRARVERQGTERLLEVELAAGQKRARVDGKGARAAQYFGGFNVVLFAPEDLRLPRGAPAGRRRFLDRAIWNAHPAYLGETQTYEKVLRSRNAVLRDGGPDRDELLEVYDAQLAAAAVPLVMRRRAIVEELSPRATAAFERVTGYGRLSLRYVTQHEDDVAARLLARLLQERGRDLARGATSSGPHTDDLDIQLDAHDAGAYASQGQTRAIVLALKIAEITLIGEKLGSDPVLLLDDVSSELDATRNAQLFAFLKTLRSQAFITTTHAAHVLLDQDRKDFRVVGGTISA
jgi:DNA replication and repair protein RecF